MSPNGEELKGYGQEMYREKLFTPEEIKNLIKEAEEHFRKLDEEIVETASDEELKGKLKEAIEAEKEVLSSLEELLRKAEARESKGD